MPLDTSIPLQIGQGAQTQAINPMTIYTMMQERQAGELKNQLIQQEMAKNALAMQNLMEDRRTAAAARAQAAAQAAEERKRLMGYRDIMSGIGVSKAAAGGRGVGYSGTGVSTDPYEMTTNALLRGAYVPQAEELAKFRKEQLLGEESRAKIPGLKAESDSKMLKARADSIGEYGDAVLRSTNVPEVFSLIDSHADTLKGLGLTTDQAKKNFVDLVGKVGFDQAIMQSSKGAMATQKHVSDMLTGQAGRTEITQDAAGNQIAIDRATGTAVPVTMAGAAGAPAAEAPAAAAPVPVKAKLSPEAEKTAVKSKEAAKGLDEATTILKDLIKPGSLLDQATGSYGGSWIDAIARGTGIGSTQGSQATAQLRVMADPILKMIPRFEGPQSDKDTQTYKEAAGMLADDTVPAGDRRAAAKALLALFKRRQGQFVSSDELANVQGGGTVSTTPPKTSSGASVSNW